MNVRWIFAGLAATALVSQGVARADVDTYPLAVRDRPDTLPKSMLEIDGDTLNINFSNDAIFKPVAITPSVYYALTDTDQIGLILSGQGLCLMGEDNGCHKVFNSISVDFQHVFVADGPAHIIGHIGVAAEAFDPNFVLAIPVGARFHFPINEKLDALVDPTVFIGITERDAGNKEFLNIPVTVRYQASENLNVFIYTAIFGPIDPASGSFTDAYTDPLGVGATYAIAHNLDVGAAFQFDNLYGKGSSADFRTLFLRVAFRTQ